MVLFDLWKSRFGRLPIVPLQENVNDCGYCSASCLLALQGPRVSVSELKARFGSTERGLSLRQVRDCLRSSGAVAEVVDITALSPDQIPIPSIVLLSRGHYVVLARRRKQRLTIFDPAQGWCHRSVATLKKDGVRFSITVYDVEGVPAQGVEQNRRTMALLRHALRLSLGRRGRRVLPLALLCQLGALALPLLTKPLVDQVAEAQQGPAVLTAVVFTLVSIGSGVIGILLASSRRLLAKQLDLSTGSVVYRALSERTSDWLQTRPPGQIFTQYQALSAVQLFGADLLSRSLAIIVLAIVGTWAMAYLSWWLLLPGLVSVAIVSTVDLMFRNRLQSLSSQAMKAQQEVRVVFADFMPLISVFRRMNVLHRARARFKSAIRGAAEVQGRRSRLDASKTSLVQILQSVERLAFACLAGLVVSSNNLSLGAFVMAGLYKDLLADAIAGTLNLLEQHALLLPQYSILEALLATDTKIALRPAACVVGKGGVVCHGVGFRHGSLDRWLFRHLNFRAVPGQLVLIVGASGGGKSTLLRLITGMSAPVEGVVCIDGQPVGSTTHGLGAVLQGDKLICDTLRENVRFYRCDLSDQAVYDALDAVGIGDFVRAMPMRLNTIVSESMNGLSSGQRQRILLARAVADKPRLLVLDEATANLDSHSERDVLLRLRSLAHTTIVCSHRPSLREVADSVWELDNGVLSELPRTSSRVEGLLESRAADESA